MADIKSYMVGYDGKTVNQIYTISKSPAYCDSKVRIMPDAHAGKGSCVGFTSTFSDKICPNTVGVDIACRVSLFNLGNEGNLWDKRDLVMFDNAVNRVVPAGFEIRNNEHRFSRDFPYEDFYCWSELKNHSHLRKSLGTLGGGNHYIELDRDEYGDVWLAIHCGSRNLGKQIAEHYQAKAIAARDERHEEARKELARHIQDYPRPERQEYILTAREELNKMWVPDDLCYLEGEELEHYLHDMRLCNEWSHLNHLAIYDSIARELGCASVSLFQNHMKMEYGYITCIHNYVDVENKIIRKGAISARAGEFGIIPLNMRDGVLIVEGLGNEDWNCSLPHGAGRILSRSEAKSTLDIFDFENTMEGIYSTSIGRSTLDEAPMAYKDANAIVEAIGENAKIVSHLYPIYNFKAH